ncbi:MAG: adenylate kinase [Chloroflexia bacterium]|nr:adenylate kinase [Chloroflexia bacterium]
MLNIVLFGPPGAGKGTQSDKLIEKYKLVHFSTGDILRAEIASQSKLGLEAKAFMDKGELVPDEVVIGMIKAKVTANKEAKGFIFDGFPRTTAQAEALDKLLKGEGLNISGMIALDVERGELTKRLQKRAEVSGRPDDADIKIINNRIDVYNKSTLPVMDFYKAQDKLQLIDGIGAIETIFERIEAAIENIK